MIKSRDFSIISVNHPDVNKTKHKKEACKMLRRTPTSIELKLDDINEFEEMRQEMAKEQSPPSKPSYNDVPNWQSGPKTKEEIYQRIGYVPPERSRTQARNLNSC